MTIHYTIKQVKPNVFLVIVPDEYERSMLFLRVQEYSESPNPRIRGQTFDILDFVKWYTNEHNKAFTYADDWNGFNISFKSAMQCYKDLPEKLTNKYDLVFLDILKQISKMLLRTHRGAELAQNAYIVSAGSAKSVTAYHELHHAQYYTDPAYRRRANAVIKTVIPAPIYNRIRQNLIRIGYYDNDFTIHNEMQAYLRGRDWTHPDIGVGIDKRVLGRIHKNMADALKI